MHTRTHATVSLSLIMRAALTHQHQHTHTGRHMHPARETLLARGAAGVAIRTSPLIPLPLLSPLLLLSCSCIRSCHSLPTSFSLSLLPLPFLRGFD